MIAKYIAELTALWLEWMKLNSITTNPLYSYKRRSNSAKKQELLTQKRYSIIAKINAEFERLIDERD